MEQRRFAAQTAGFGLLAKLKAVAARLKRNIIALHLAARDPRTPWYAKLFVVCVVPYALSPIDLIPDVIPVLGYLDDLLLLPLGIYIAMKLIPPKILADCQAEAAAGENLPRSWSAAVFVILAGDHSAAGVFATGSSAASFHQTNNSGISSRKPKTS